METITMKLNSPITDEQWNIITDAELEHSDEIEFTTPSGKKVMYAKVRHGKWIYTEYKPAHGEGIGYFVCSECGHATWNVENNHYCFHCGAKMDLDEEEE